MLKALAMSIAVICLPVQVQAAEASLFQIMQFRLKLTIFAPDSAKMNNAQIALLSRVNSGLELTTDLIAFLTEFDSGPESLSAYLAQVEAWRKDAQAGRAASVIEDWLRLPGLNSLAHDYRSLIANGWQFELVNQRPKRMGKPVFAVTKWTEKKVQIYIGLTDEPLPMVFAEELIHARDFELYNANKKSVDNWMRYQIAESAMPGLDTISQLERYQWSTIVGIQRWADASVTPTQVAEAFKFVMEQGAYIRKVEIYRSLRANNQYHTKSWDLILKSETPTDTVNTVLSQLKFPSLEQRLVNLLNGASVAAIVGASGETSVGELPGMQTPSIGQPTLPWNTLAEWLQVVPPLLQTREYLSALNSLQVDKLEKAIVSAITPEQLQPLIDFILNRHLAPKPYAARNALTRRFSTLTSDPGLFDVYRMFKFISDVLIAYDKAHGTNYKVDVLFKVLSELHSDRDTGDNYGLFQAVSMALSGSNHLNPRTATDFLRVIQNSRSAGGFLFDLNSGSDLAKFLRLAAEGYKQHLHGALSPQEAMTLLIVRINHMKNLAATDRTGMSYSYNDLALRTIDAGITYMADVGEPLLHQRLKLMKSEQAAKMGRENTRTQAINSQRDAAPSDHNESGIGPVAAALIVQAKKYKDSLNKESNPLLRRVLGINGDDAAHTPLPLSRCSRRLMGR